MEVPKPYFIGFAYFGLFGEHPQYHVAKKISDHFITACAINTILRESDPEYVKEKEPVKGGRWTICQMCKRQWKRKRREFKFAKQARVSPDSY